jgi:2-polyprenyl-3-methyl-5-hydroxy-6-metoxy-1,4-benzoquinol methylase
MMKPLDRILQEQRIARSLPWIPAGSRVLDIGCADGALFRAGKQRIGSGVGIDLRADTGWVSGPFERRIGTFPGAIANGEQFDAVTMLAVVEHVPTKELAGWAAALPPLIVPGGVLVITTPSPKVDTILHALIKIRAIDGMAVHEHYGFQPRLVPRIFSSKDLILEKHNRFQLGLNNLFVFRRTARA